MDKVNNVQSKNNLLNLIPKIKKFILSKQRETAPSSEIILKSDSDVSGV